MKSTGSRTGTALRTAAVSAADTAVLWCARPDTATLRRLATRPGAALTELGADHVIAVCVGSALWLVAAWVGLGLLAVAVSRLPGTCGRAGAALDHLLPSALRRALGLALGIALVAGPASAAAAAPVRSSSVSAASIDAVRGATPGPGWPVTPGSGSTPSTRHHDARPPLTPRPSPSPSHEPDGTQRVRVNPGDSLWLIAARRLPHPSAGDVAAYWPRVYAANRSVVGADPDHIVAGQVLRLPAPPDTA